MIEVNSLTRRYGNNMAVNDVSFRIGANEIVGLLGHNGAGKTTIMRMLSGYLEPCAGSIRIGGVSLADDAHSIQRELGYLPESLPVYPDMMVADYLHYAATLKGIDPGRVYPAVRQAILATDLGKRALDPVATLSRGLKQRVGVAQAILGKPRLLILDEPTNGLDPQGINEVRELILQIAAQGTTIFLASHLLDEVQKVCSHVAILRSGNALYSGPVADILGQAILGKPRLLILDEPTNGLDPQQTDHMRRLIQRLSRQATVILSTHIMQEVDAICDRVLVLRHGKLALDKHLDSLRQSRTLLLHTDDAPEYLADYLKRMPQIASLHQHPPADGRCRFTLTLHENSDIDTAANNVAQCVVKAGARLYQLRPVVQGLEAVFHEVNSDGA